MIGEKCRVIGHAWDFTTVDRDGKFYIQRMRCLRPGCGTQRSYRINAKTGETGGSSYVYPEGYIRKGGFTPDDRAKLRLRVIRRNVQ